MIRILRNQSSSSHWCKRWTPKSSISDILLVLDLLHRKWNNSDSGVDWQILVLHILTVQASFHLNLMNCIYSNIKALRGKIWQALEIIAINTSSMYSSEWVHMMFDVEYDFQHCRTLRVHDHMDWMTRNNALLIGIKVSDELLVNLKEYKTWIIAFPSNLWYRDKFFENFCLKESSALNSLVFWCNARKCYYSRKVRIFFTDNALGKFKRWYFEQDCMN